MSLQLVWFKRDLRVEDHRPLAEPALHLARLLTDHEPGINTLRIYNPVKQARDQDPEAVFVRRWIPELAGVPPEQSFEPWKLGLAERERYGAATCSEPLVDHQQAAQQARARIAEYRRRPGFREQARAIQQALGSGKKTTRRRNPVREKQASLF